MLKKIGIVLCLTGYYAALYGLYSALGLKGIILGIVAAVCACIGTGTLGSDEEQEE